MSRCGSKERTRPSGEPDEAPGRKGSLRGRWQRCWPTDTAPWAGVQAAEAPRGSSACVTKMTCPALLLVPSRRLAIREAPLPRASHCARRGPCSLGTPHALSCFTANPPGLPEIRCLLAESAWMTAHQQTRGSSSPWQIFIPG